MKSRVLEPIMINGLELPNRVVVPAMLTHYCNEDGILTEKNYSYHVRRAKGGWGLVITEDYAISDGAASSFKVPGIWSEDQIASNEELTRRVHNAGGRIAAQLFHAGRVAYKRHVGPSSLPDPNVQGVVHTLATSEIDQIIEDFAQAAQNAKKAGFDAIEIHGAHGYLINQFLSPFSNKRSDEYGGSVRNRARLACEVVRAVRVRVGEEFPILFRMSVDEYLPGGLSVCESQAIARLLEEAGVDCLHCSQGVISDNSCIIPSFRTAKAAYVSNAAAIREVVSVPVIAVGRINSFEIAESVLEEGAADMVAMGRASLVDPDALRKYAEGRADDIRHCIACLQGCIGENRKGGFVHCALDPMTGMEDEYAWEDVEIPKKVLVVGGGVAGCEAAIVAASRGHDVTLVEKASVLGGQWRLAASAVGKADFAGFVFWQQHILEQLGVNVLLDTPLTQSLIDEGEYEVVVDATGGTELMPPIEGIGDSGYVTAYDVFERGLVTGGVAAVIGGGLSGAEIAEHLAVHGAKEVHVFEMRDSIACDADAVEAAELMDSLDNLGVKCHVGARVTEVSDGRILYFSDDAEEEVDGVDFIVLACGVRPVGIPDEISLREARLHVVGDASSPKDGYHNIREGFEVGLAL